MIKILGIIPARYASTRFPGKPLVDIEGKTMIQRVYEQCTKADKLSDVIIATDDERIFSHVTSFNAKAVMTSPSLQSGTDRCAEVISTGDYNFDVIINIQGDEPFIKPEQINSLCELFYNKKCEIGTLVKKISSQEELFNHNVVKVVLSEKGRALYFSRNPIPYNRNFPENEWLRHSTYYKHIGIYGYKKETLQKISRLPKANLEIAESLEQLRWLEKGYEIDVEITDYESIGIDTPEDLKKVKTV